jgi:hypothetical protein
LLAVHSVGVLIAGELPFGIGLARHYVMSEWQQVDVPAICERMIGFSIPNDGVILVVSYEGMHLVNVAAPVSVETDVEFLEYDCYNPDLGIAEYRGERWSIIGLCPGTPILTSPRAEELRLDAKGLRISLWQNGAETWSSSFKNFSGDWAAATFSPDGNLIVLGCPYDFDFRVWRRQ